MAATDQPIPPPRRGVRETFTAHYEVWLTKLEQEFQGKLLECLEQQGEKEDEAECKELIEAVLNHYGDFFNEKDKAAKEDVFVVISPPWFSSLERTILWISAFKPSMLFSIIKNSSDQIILSADQKEKMDNMRDETRKTEKDLEKKLAEIQESIAGNNAAFESLRRYGSKLMAGEVIPEMMCEDINYNMEKLKSSMVMVIEDADGLRVSTARKIMEVLKPLQNMKLLYDFGQLVIHVRRFGIRKDAISSSFSSHDHDDDDNDDED